MIFGKNVFIKFIWIRLLDTDQASNCQFGPKSNFSRNIPSPYPIYPRSMKLLSMYRISPTFSYPKN